MATPRRRSSRLNSGTAATSTPTQNRTNAAVATPLTNKLSSLLERDESPDGEQANIDAVVSTPMVPPNTTVVSHGSFGLLNPSPGKMPGARPTPSIKAVGTETLQTTPSKGNTGPPKTMTSPSFEFRFERPESDLSMEAQKIMDSVREEAARIKTQMMEEKMKQQDKDGKTNQLFGVNGRKIAKPKGKAGRFSDVHKQEFQKMDSIVHHASTWKNKLKADTPALKRSSSKAELDNVTPKSSIPRSKSMRSLHFGNADRAEASPGKRVKRGYLDDASTARPASQDQSGSELTTPAKQRPSTKLPSAISTPTKASLARSASVKNMKTAMMPSLTRSASTKTLGKPAPKSEGSNKYLNSLTHFGAVKSILHRSPQKLPSQADDSAAPSPSKLPKLGANVDKQLPSLPSSPSKQNLGTPSTIKQVNFADSPAAKSPSRSQIPTPKTKSILKPQPAPAQDVEMKEAGEVSYPLIAESPNVTTRRPAPAGNASPSKATITDGPGNFTFRTEQTIQFSSGAAPTIPNRASSLDKPLPPKRKLNTIRHVRPSGLPTPLNGPTTFSAMQMPGSFEPFPTIEHGINNKKRKHIDLDDEDEQGDENADIGIGHGDKAVAMENNQEDALEDQGPKAKRARLNSNTSALEPVSLNAVNTSSPLKRRFKAAGNVGGKGKLTLGRLNVLARPKQRR